MVIYYSWSGNTKAYAEALAGKKGLPLFRLEEKAARKASGKLSFLKACAQGILKKKIEAVSLPDIAGCDEIFVCTPVWADGPAPTVRWFLDRARLEGKKVNLLFTYGSSQPEGFEKNTLALLEGKGCTAGDIYAFTAKFRQSVDMRAVEENLSR